jgi:hypothetical protein
MPDDRVAALVAELDATRDAFSDALAGADAQLLTAPGLVGDWSARELIAHLAHWDRWATTCLEHPSPDGLASLVTGEWDVDAQNAEVAAGAAGMSLDAVRDDEAEAFAAFRERLASLDDAALDVQAPWGGTLETVVRENGPDHYRPHAEEVAAWFGGGDDDTDDEPGQGRQLGK